MISSAWKCLLLWRDSILDRAYKQKKRNRKKNNKKKGGEVGGKGFSRGLGHIQY